MPNVSQQGGLYLCWHLLAWERPLTWEHLQHQLLRFSLRVVGPCHKYLGTFNAIQNNGVHWDYWDPANPNKLWGELGVLAGQEGLVSNFLIIVI